MKLIAITFNGIPENPIESLPKVAQDVMKSTAEMYRATGFHLPWVAEIEHPEDGTVWEWKKTEKSQQVASADS